MPKEKFANKVEDIFKDYTKEDVPAVKDTISMLCKKGIADGCYQDYAMLADIVSVLASIEEYISEKED